MEHFMRFMTLVLVGLMGLWGCDGDDSDGHHEEESVAAHACEHLDGGLAEVVVGAEFASKTYPDVSAEHTRYDVALDDLDADGLSYLSYQATDEGDHILFLTEDVPVTILGPDGDEVVPEESEGSPEDCPGFAAHHVVELDIGTYTLVLGPAEVDAVSLVIYVGSDEHEHEED